MELLGLTVALFCWGWASRYKMIAVDRRRKPKRRAKYIMKIRGALY